MRDGRGLFMLVVGVVITPLFAWRLLRLLVLVGQGDLTLGRAALGLLTQGLLLLGCMMSVVMGVRRLRGHVPEQPEIDDPKVKRQMIITLTIVTGFFAAFVVGAFVADDDQRGAYAVLAIVSGLLAALPWFAVFKLRQRRRSTDPGVE